MPSHTRFVVRPGVACELPPHAALADVERLVATLGARTPPFTADLVEKYRAAVRG